MTRSLHVRLAASLVLASLLGCSSSSSSAPEAPGSDAGAGAGGGDAGSATFTPPPAPTGTPVSPPLHGTGGLGYAVGSAFPGAAAPNGMAKVGPDTRGPWGTASFLHESGYWYGDDTILGFSHLHLHGTGAADYGVLATMPVPDFDASRTTDAGHQSTFAKASEQAEPGYYAVTLDHGGIRVELTATPHAACHRYTFAAGAKTGHVIVDLDHHLSGGSVKDAEATLDPVGRTIRGRLRSIGQMSGGFGGYDVFFAARAKQAWTRARVWSNGAAPADGTTVKGTGVGFVLDFDTSSHAPVELEVGLSLVSLDAAAANLAAELPAFDFDGARKATAAAWQKRLDAVRVTGGEAVERAMLEAMLYHLYLMPSVLSDVAGTYVGLDGQVHEAKGFDYVSDLSLWDTYRTLHPLYALLAPDRARDAVRSLVAMGKDGGYVPKWPIATGEAGSMIGASGEVVLADAWLKGVRDFDAEGAYALLRAAAMDATPPPHGRGGRDGSEGYMKLGYMDASQGRSVSHTLEWAQDDFALAALARGLGHTADADALLARSHGWRTLYDPKDGFLWAKDAEGHFAPNRPDPITIGEPFVEANAWQSLWGAPHDLDGLVALMGTREAVVDKLESFFEQGKADHDALDPANQPLTAYAPRPYYWGGNEPDIHAPWLFARLGRPDLTQYWVRWAMRSLYGPGADGLPGNDDGGAMSAWWVFAALGLYPVVGTDAYVLGAPLFPHAELAVPGGTFTIDANGVSTENLYVQSATLNGAPLARPELTHAELRPGGSLVFTMGPSPSTWGR
jgi:predicted alpha-1,2-mannosidase